MKTINKIFILLVTGIIISSCGGNEQSNKEETAIEISTENLIVADYVIEGMVCAMGCAATIEKDVAEMNGVVSASVDYEAEKAHFEFDEAIISEKEIIAKIEGLADGQYKVSGWNAASNESIEDEEESEGTEESVVEVSLPSFEIPNLFTLLMDQI